MISLTVAELVGAIGAVPHRGLTGGDARGGYSTGGDLAGAGDAMGARVLEMMVDSRTVRPGSLFVALPGERVDGHDYVVTAFAQGAVAAITNRPLAVDGLCLVVDDPVAAMGLLARHLVDRAAAEGLQVAAVTGSQGKTSTKDLLAHVLEQAGPTVAPYGNLNNELGVPLTVSRIDERTRFLVVEMGARGKGQVAYLCRLAPPQVGAVLNVGQAHVGEFGSQQAIAEAKGELVEAVPADGVAVLNAEDPLVWAMRHRTAAQVLGFSDRSEPATPRAVWASEVHGDEVGRHHFRLHAKRPGSAGSAAEVRLLLTGRHQVANAVAAAAMATALGVGLDQVADALSTARLRSRSRMEVHERGDQVMVVNDAYNANPDSSRAAVDTLVELGRARRRFYPQAVTWAVLGDMLELGASAGAEHLELGRHVGESGIDRLVAIGAFAAELVRGAVEAGVDARHAVTVADKAAAVQSVAPHLRPGDTVLVKASRGLTLDTVAEDLWTSAGPEPTSLSEDPA